MLVGIDFKFPFDKQSMRISVCQMFMVFDIDNFCQILKVNRIKIDFYIFRIELFAWHMIFLICIICMYSEILFSIRLLTVDS